MAINLKGGAFAVEEETNFSLWRKKDDFGIWETDGPDVRKEGREMHWCKITMGTTKCSMHP